MAATDAKPIAVLLVGGLDTSGRAGLLRDAQAVQEHFLHTALVTTATAVQTPEAVVHIQRAGPKVIEKQVEAASSTYRIAAAKVGLVPDASTGAAVAEALEGLRCPVVLDPVRSASAGGTLSRDWQESMAALAPIASLVTPNLDEARPLAGDKGRDPVGLARRILRDHGPGAVLVKGGHAAANDAGTVEDVLVPADGEVMRFAGPRVPHSDVLRGRGCLLASHIAAGLALGQTVAQAVEAGCVATRDRLALEERSLTGQVRGPSTYAEYLRGFQYLRSTLAPACVPEVGMNVAWAPPEPGFEPMGLAGRITIAGDSFGVVGLPAPGGPHHTGRIVSTLRELSGASWCVLNHRYRPELVAAAQRLGLEPVEVRRHDQPTGREGTMEWASQAAYGKQGDRLRVFWDAGMPGKEAMVRLAAPTMEELAGLHGRLHQATGPSADGSRPGVDGLAGEGALGASSGLVD